MTSVDAAGPAYPMLRRSRFTGRSVKVYGNTLRRNGEIYGCSGGADGLALRGDRLMTPIVLVSFQRVKIVKSAIKTAS